MEVSEAEKLVCPFMSGPITTIDGYAGNYETTCIASNCMAWKFIQKEIHKAHESDEQEYFDTKEGYCQRLQT